MVAYDTLFRVSFACALLGGCANRYEVRGDRALAAGDREEAVKQYENGLAQRPIMDFEYEALRAKRARLLTDSWVPRIVLAKRTADASGRAAALVALHEEAKEKRVTASIRAKISSTLLEAIHDLSSQPGTVADMLALLDRLKADTTLWLAAADAIGGAASLGLPEVAKLSNLEALVLLLDLREGLRTRGVPAGADAKIDGGLAALASRPTPSVSAGEATAIAASAVALRERAAKLGAPPAAIAIADRAFEAAAPHLVAVADRAAAEHHYAAALAALGPIAARADTSSIVRTRYRAIAAQGAAWHTAQAAQLPAGYRKLVHLDLARSMAPAASAAAEDQRTALRADWQTQLALEPRAGRNDGCAVLWPRVAAPYATTGKAIATTIDLSCTSGETVARATKTINFEHEVEFFVQELVVVGTRREKVQVGSHDEQCSKDSSLEGYTWQGVCKVPDYEWRTVEIKELRPVRKTRIDKGSQQYEETTRTVTARVSGSARITWDDGTVLSVPIATDATQSSTSFDVTYPGAKIGDAPRREHRADDRGLTPTSVLENRASTTRSQIADGLARQVRAHRAKLARAEGVAAAARGDTDAAGEAFARSAMLGDAVESEAATWFTTTHAIDAATAFSIMHTSNALFGEPAPRAAITANTYSPAAVELSADNQAATADSVYERDTEKEGTRGDEGATSILSPVERLGAWIGFAPYSVMSRDREQQQRTYAGMLEFNTSPIGKAVGRRYGVTFHDDLVTRILVGAGGSSDYTNGSSEGRFGWGWGVSYHGLLGFRTHHIGVFAGAGGGYAYFRGGDDKSRGFFAEPAARITVRPWGVGILAIEAMGFVSLGDMARRDAISISLPLHRHKTGQIRFAYEQTDLSTEVRDADGMTTIDLGRQVARLYVMTIGGRF